jgi:thiamine-phosphate pyrophosphorylase
MTAFQFATSRNPKQQKAECEAALKGGCKWILLRFDGNAPKEKNVKTAQKLKELCRCHEAMLLVENDIETAKEAIADGVHFSSINDATINARGVLGEGFIIGYTATGCSEINSAKSAGADYVAVAAEDETAAADRYADILDGVAQSGTDIPVVVLLHGANVGEITKLKQAGANGFALAVDEGSAYYRDKDAICDIASAIIAIE